MFYVLDPLGAGRDFIPSLITGDLVFIVTSVVSSKLEIGLPCKYDGSLSVHYDQYILLCQRGDGYILSLSFLPYIAWDHVGTRVGNRGALSTLCHLEPFRGIPNGIPVLSMQTESPMTANLAQKGSRPGLAKCPSMTDSVPSSSLCLEGNRRVADCPSFLNYQILIDFALHSMLPLLHNHLNGVWNKRYIVGLKSPIII